MERDEIKYKILVVDDEKHSCLSLDALLGWEGHNVTTVISGLFALDEIEKTTKINEPFDILITDLMMSGMDGFDLIEKINEMELELKIVLMSAYVKGEEIRKFCNKGAYTFIAKPVNKYELFNVINNKDKKVEDIVYETDIVTLMGILYACPYDKELGDCPLKEVRYLDFKERVAWISKI